jgi:hypothetical protein
MGAGQRPAPIRGTAAGSLIFVLRGVPLQGGTLPIATCC